MKKNYLKTKMIISALLVLTTAHSCQRESLHKNKSDI